MSEAGLAFRPLSKTLMQKTELDRGGEEILMKINVCMAELCRFISWITAIKDSKRKAK